MYLIKEIEDKKNWEEFITNNAGKTTSPTSFIQSWNWGNFLISQKQKIFRLGIYENDNLIGVALGTKVEARRGKYLHFRHGPVINWQDTRLVEFVIGELKQVAKNEGAWFVRISPLIENSKILETETKKSQMHGIDAEETWVLDLNDTEESLLQSMRKNTRYLIRKATKMGVTIEQTKDLGKLEIFWEIFQDTVQRHKWTAYSFDYIKHEFEAFLEDDQNVLFLAKYEGKYIASAIFNFYNNQSVYHHSGSLSEYQKIPASYLMQWEAIKEAKKRGLEKHNFWGLPLNEKNELDMEDPWAGLGLFKVGFGGRAEKWIHARDIPVSFKYNFTHYYEKFENWKRKLKGKSN